MRRPKLTRPTVELFSDGEILNAYALNRWGAFRQPMEFPLRRLRTYPDHVELRWPDRDKPAQIIWLDWTRCLGAERPWFICYRCSRRCAILYNSTIDAACRKCVVLQYTSQRQTRKARLQTKAEKIRARIWLENGNPARPYYMHRATYQKHLHKLARIEHAIRSNQHCASVRYQRPRDRDEYGQYCD